MAKIRIARRYAKALFDLADDSNQLDRVWDDLKSLSSITKESAELAHFLQDPLLSTERKTVIFSTMLKDKLDALTLKFVLFLVEKKRIGLLQHCCTAFDDLYYLNRGILKVAIISAMEMGTDQINSIKQKLKEKFQKEIESHVSINPSLLGGFKVIVGDQVLDFTLETQLQRIKKNIISA